MTTPLHAAVDARADRYGVSALNSQGGLRVESGDQPDRERAADEAPQRPILEQMLDGTTEPTFDPHVALESGRRSQADVKVVVWLNQEDAP